MMSFLCHHLPIMICILKRIFCGFMFSFRHIKSGDGMMILNKSLNKLSMHNIVEILRPQTPKERIK